MYEEKDMPVYRETLPRYFSSYFDAECRTVVDQDAVFPALALMQDGDMYLDGRPPDVDRAEDSQQDLLDWADWFFDWVKPPATTNPANIRDFGMEFFADEPVATVVSDDEDIDVDDDGGNLALWSLFRKQKL